MSEFEFLFENDNSFFIDNPLENISLDSPLPQSPNQNNGVVASPFLTAANSNTPFDLNDSILNDDTFDLALNDQLLNTTTTTPTSTNATIGNNNTVNNNPTSSAMMLDSGSDQASTLLKNDTNTKLDMNPLNQTNNTTDNNKLMMNMTVNPININNMNHSASLSALDNISGSCPANIFSNHNLSTNNNNSSLSGSVNTSTLFYNHNNNNNNGGNNTISTTIPTTNPLNNNNNTNFMNNTNNGQGYNGTNTQNLSNKNINHSSLFTTSASMSDINNISLFDNSNVPYEKSNLTRSNTAPIDFFSSSPSSSPSFSPALPAALSPQTRNQYQYYSMNMNINPKRTSSPLSLPNNTITSDDQSLKKNVGGYPSSNTTTVMHTKPIPATNVNAQANYVRTPLNPNNLHKTLNNNYTTTTPNNNTFNNNTTTTTLNNTNTTLFNTPSCVATTASFTLMNHPQTTQPQQPSQQSMTTLPYSNNHLIQPTTNTSPMPQYATTSPMVPYTSNISNITSQMLQSQTQSQNRTTPPQQQQQLLQQPQPQPPNSNIQSPMLQYATANAAGILQSSPLSQPQQIQSSPMQSLRSINNSAVPSPILSYTTTTSMASTPIAIPMANPLNNNAAAYNNSFNNNSYGSCYSQSYNSFNNSFSNNNNGNSFMNSYTNANSIPLNNNTTVTANALSQNTMPPTNYINNPVVESVKQELSYPSSPYQSSSCISSPAISIQNSINLSCCSDISSPDLSQMNLNNNMNNLNNSLSSINSVISSRSQSPLTLPMNNNTIVNNTSPLQRNNNNATPPPPSSSSTSINNTTNTTNGIYISRTATPIPISLSRNNSLLSESINNRLSMSAPINPSNLIHPTPTNPLQLSNKDMINMNNMNITNINNINNLNNINNISNNSMSLGSSTMNGNGNSMAAYMASHGMKTSSAQLVLRGRRVTREVSGGSNVKQFICPYEGCGKIFKRSEHLKRHNRVHTGERPFVCNECHKRFSRSDNLAQHKKTHRKDKVKKSHKKIINNNSSTSTQRTSIIV